MKHKHLDRDHHVLGRWKVVWKRRREMMRYEVELEDLLRQPEDGLAMLVRLIYDCDETSVLKERCSLTHDLRPLLPPMSIPTQCWRRVPVLHS